MPSLVETLGGWGQSLFVPSNVIESQNENQKMLVAKAEQLNGNAPSVLATATKSGILTDGTVKQSLQDMNRAIYLVNDSERQLGQEIVSNVLESAANAPATLINYTSDQVLKPTAGAIKGTVQSLVPWQLWVILGLGVVVLAGIYAFVKAKTV